MSASAEQITHCKWCDRVSHRAAEGVKAVWLGRPAWEARHGRLVGPLLHGICPSCVAVQLENRARLSEQAARAAARERIDGMEAFHKRRAREAQFRRLVERRLLKGSGGGHAGGEQDGVVPSHPGTRRRHDDRAAYNRLRAVLGLPTTLRRGK
jgi:hypothetical protein